MAAYGIRSGHTRILSFWYILGLANAVVDGVPSDHAID
jgi:hypothetical protein